jgi:hypothetical protein
MTGTIEFAPLISAEGTVVSGRLDNAAPRA